MKKLKLYIAAAVLAVAALASGNPSQVSAAKYVNQADINIVEVATDAFTDFADESNSPSATTTTLDIKAQAAATALYNVSTHSFYRGGDKYLAEAEVLKKQADDLATEVKKAGSVVESDDQDAISEYFDNLQTLASAFDDQMAKVSAAVQESNDSTGGMYLAGLIAAGVISALAFLWAFIRPRGAAQTPQVAKARRLVAFSSLAPVAGLAITYFTFEYATRNGGGYSFVWGLVVFGLIWFIGAIIEYNKVRKAAPAVPGNPTKPTNPTPPATPIV